MERKRAPELVPSRRSGEQFVLRLQPKLASVRTARNRLALVAAEWGCPAGIIEDASVVLSELLSNAVLHAGTPLRAVISPSASGGLLIEVYDESPLPVRPALPSAGELPAATGRGLAVVAALASDWGWSATPGNGKVVWAEVGLRRANPTAKAARGGLHRVSLVGVPLRLLKASEDHFDDLFRELQMAFGFAGPSASRPTGVGSTVTAGPLARLASQAGSLKSRLATLREPARRALWEASQRGDDVIDLDLVVDDDLVEVLVSSEKFLRGAAWSARAGYLLTEPPGPEVDAWRKWLASELKWQMAGGAPRPCPFGGSAGDASAAYKE